MANILQARHHCLWQKFTAIRRAVVSVNQFIVETVITSSNQSSG